MKPFFYSLLAVSAALPAAAQAEILRTEDILRPEEIHSPEKQRSVFIIIGHGTAACRRDDGAGIVLKSQVQEEIFQCQIPALCRMQDAQIMVCDFSLGGIGVGPVKGRFLPASHHKAPSGNGIGGAGGFPVQGRKGNGQGLRDSRSQEGTGKPDGIRAFLRGAEVYRDGGAAAAVGKIIRNLQAGQDRSIFGDSLCFPQADHKLSCAQGIEICYQMALLNIGVHQEAAQIADLISIAVQRLVLDRCEAEGQGQLPDTEHEASGQSLLWHVVIEPVIIGSFCLLVSGDREGRAVKMALPVGGCPLQRLPVQQILVPDGIVFSLERKGVLFLVVYGQA